MEQRRIISVIFLVTVIVMALLLFAQYNKVPLSTVPVLQDRTASAQLPVPDLTVRTDAAAEVTAVEIR